MEEEGGCRAQGTMPRDFAGSQISPPNPAGRVCVWSAGMGVCVVRAQQTHRRRPRWVVCVGSRRPSPPPPGVLPQWLTRAGVEGDHEHGHHLVLLHVAHLQAPRLQQHFGGARRDGGAPLRGLSAAPRTPVRTPAHRLQLRGLRRGHGGALGPAQKRRRVSLLHHGEVKRGGAAGAEGRAQDRLRAHPSPAGLRLLLPRGGPRTCPSPCPVSASLARSRVLRSALCARVPCAPAPGQLYLGPWQVPSGPRHSGLLILDVLHATSPGGRHWSPRPRQMRLT